MTVSGSRFVTIIIAKNDDYNLFENLKFLSRFTLLVLPIISGHPTVVAGLVKLKAS